jgi:hypothetical protein
MEDIINCDEEMNMLVSIDTAEIPITFYNVSAAIGNNKFEFYEGSNSPTTITLPSQNYDIDNITESLPTLLNTASSIGATYDVSFNESTYKLTITSSSTTVFYLDFNDHKQTGKLLGFLPSLYTSSSKTLDSVTPVNMNSIPFIFLDTSFGASGSIITSNRDDIKTFGSGVLSKIQIDRNFGDYITHKTHGSRHSLVIQRKRIHSLRFTLKDPNFKTVDLNGVPFSLTLTIDFIDFKSGGVYDTTDPRQKKITTTREDVNENLTQTMMAMGRELQQDADDRNKIIQLLNQG